MLEASHPPRLCPRTSQNIKLWESCCDRGTKGAATSCLPKAKRKYAMLDDSPMATQIDPNGRRQFRGGS